MFDYSLKTNTVLIHFSDEKRSCLIADKTIRPSPFKYLHIKRKRGEAILPIVYLHSLYIFFFICRSGDDYDNCLLSDEPFGSLNTAADLDYDLSWNVYRLSETNCVNDNYSEGKKNITEYYSGLQKC